MASQLALRKQLLNLKPQRDASLFRHFTNSDTIISDAKLDEMDTISHLLLTVPSTYDGVINALETFGDAYLNVAFVKTILLDYEVKIKNETTTAL